WPRPPVRPSGRRGVRRREFRVLDCLADIAGEFEGRRENLTDRQASEAEHRADGAGGHAYSDPIAAGHALFPFFFLPAHRGLLIGTVSSGRFSAFESYVSTSPGLTLCDRCRSQTRAGGRPSP